MNRSSLRGRRALALLASVASIAALVAACATATEDPFTDGAEAGADAASPLTDAAHADGTVTPTHDAASSSTDASDASDASDAAASRTSDATTPTDSAPPDAVADATTLDATLDASPDAPLDALAPVADAQPYACSVTSGIATFLNGNVRIDYDLTAGTATFSYAGVPKIKNFYAGVQLASYTTNKTYTTRLCSALGDTFTVTNTASGQPTMTQSFVLGGGDAFLTTLTVTGTGLSTNWISPVVMDTTGGVDVGTYGDSRVLWIPFDNDAWVSYNAASIAGTNSGTSFEAAAFYDNVSRNGIVVGSVTHDTWKSGVYYSSASNKLNAMNVFGGATDATWTHDVVPHGKVSGADGTSVSSPTMFVGYAPDWRDLMEEYAAANVAHQPKLGWNGGVPFGWNSWGKIQTKISYDAAVAVSDYIAGSMQDAGFSNDGVVYVNLDSYWDNLSAAQLADFVAHCHANGQKAGVYWTPFVDWGESATRIVEGTTATPYSQIWLRDGSNNPIPLDGAYAVDPTSPATQTRVNYFIDMLKGYGFDYIKLDFLSHGALESSTRADPTVQTGIQAYNQGMAYVLGRIGGSMFVSESIAPLFPYQYGHARRVSCDVTGSATTGQGSAEYELNSATYGWWMSGRLYSFNDPDMMVFEGYTADDNMTRLLSAVISGTVFLDGDDLTESTGQTLARSYLTNPQINAVARRGVAFRPVEGNTGTAPSNVFVSQDPDGAAYLAVFNYGTTATTTAVDLTRAGLDGTKTYAVTDLWTGAASSATTTLSVSLDAGFGRLFELQ